MQPLRKPSDPVLTPPPAESAPPEHGIPVNRDLVNGHGHGDLPMSPALLLREQLAARLAETMPSSEPDAFANEQAVDKWPVAMRLVTIGTISIALWSGILLTAANLATK